jgi:hypothetical protein
MAFVILFGNRCRMIAWPAGLFVILAFVLAQADSVRREPQPEGPRRAPVSHHGQMGFTGEFLPGLTIVVRRDGIVCPIIPPEDHQR